MSPPPRRVDRAKIERLLAVSLGDERAKQAWLEASRGVGVALSESYSMEHTLAVLDALGGAPGLPGVAARFARVRVEQGEAGEYVPRDRPSSSQLRALTPVATPAVDPRPGRTTPFTTSQSGELVDLLSFLAPALGEEKAREVIAQQARILGKDPNALSRTDALALLDSMEHASGLLGVVVSFAKVKFLLRYPG